MLAVINHGARRGPVGLGDTTVSTSSQIAGGIATSATAASVAFPPAAPFILAGAAIASFLVKNFGIGDGCGATCTQATDVVNQIIPLMQKNLAAVQAQLNQNGGCLTPDQQSTGLAQFDQLWGAMVTACQRIGGGGGKGCVDDRQRGGKYDCFVTLRDPIAAMPSCDLNSVYGDTLSTVASLAANIPTSVSSIGPSSLGGLLPLLAGGLLLYLVVE